MFVCSDGGDIDGQELGETEEVPMEEEEEEEVMEEAEIVNPAVIYRAPQIVIPPAVVAIQPVCLWLWLDIGLKHAE